MPFDLAELSVGELRSSDRKRNEAKCSFSRLGHSRSPERWCRFVNADCLPSCRVKCSATRKSQIRFDFEVRIGTV